MIAFLLASLFAFFFGTDTWVWIAFFAVLILFIMKRRSRKPKASNAKF